MTEVRLRPRVEPEYFERLYAEDADPWRFASSVYERDKYAHTLAALGARRYGTALEIGCSIGVFTRQLASRCESVCALDVSTRALDLARQAGTPPNVHWEHAAFPERMPAGPWDLVVCSEVLYYLDLPAFERAVGHLHDAMEANATVLAVHWRPPTRTYPLRGDEVHDRLVAALGRYHALDERHERYRLDRFDPAPRAS